MRFVAVILSVISCFRLFQAFTRNGFGYSVYLYYLDSFTITAAHSIAISLLTCLLRHSMLDPTLVLTFTDKVALSLFTG
jgi:hypothetical protein